MVLAPVFSEADACFSSEVACDMLRVVEACCKGNLRNTHRAVNQHVGDDADTAFPYLLVNRAVEAGAEARHEGTNEGAT